MLRSPFRDSESLGTERIEVKPNASRCSPIEQASHIQPQQSRLCGRASWTPPHQIQHRGFEVLYAV